MNSSDEQHRKIESLMSAYCEGNITPEQLQQLQQLLRGDAEVRRNYLAYIDMHARLTVHPHLATGIPKTGVFSPQDEQVLLKRARDSFRRDDDPPQPTVKRRRIALAKRRLALSLLLVFAVIVGWQLYDPMGPTPVGPVIREVVGAATVEVSSRSSSAQTGQRLKRGERLRLGDDARVTLSYDDGTRVVVYSHSEVEIPTAGDQAHFRVLSGAIAVNAAPQPIDQPLVFATEHANYSVLGTRFRLYKETAASRLELDEGQIRLQRQVDGETIDLSANQVAIATSEATPIDVRALSSGKANLRKTFAKAGDVVAFSPDGRSVASGHRRLGLRLWNLDDNALQFSADAKLGRHGALNFSSDGRVLVHVTDSSEEGVITLWRPGETGVRTLPLLGEKVRSRALSPDGLYVAESGDDGTYVYRLVVTTPEIERRAELPSPGKAWSLALSQSGQFAAGGYWGGKVRVYREPADAEPTASSLERILFKRKIGGIPTQVALSEDGRLLAAFAEETGLQLIDLSTGQQQTIWAGSGVTVLKFTPDGKRLLAGLHDQTARLWATDDGLPLAVIDTGHVPRDIAWSETSSLLATADGDVKLWACEIP